MVKGENENIFTSGGKTIIENKQVAIAATITL